MQVLSDEENNKEQGEEGCEEAKYTDDIITIDHFMHHTRCTELAVQLEIRDVRVPLNAVMATSPHCDPLVDSRKK